MSDDDWTTPKPRPQDGYATRISSIGNLALNDVTRVQHDPDRDFFNQHRKRRCYLRRAFAHERTDWLARGAEFDRPDTTDLVVVKQFADNGFRVRLPVTLCPAGVAPETFCDDAAEEIFDLVIADRRLRDPEGRIVSMTEALERFAEAVQQKRRQA